jgi:beta-phosphoglucomutase-like phosphatase (HAD superfamily)
MPLEALIFDVDGTLAETEEVHRSAFNRAFAAFGLDWVWPSDVYRDLLRVTGGKERIRHFVETFRPRQGSLALANLAAIHAKKNSFYADLVDRGMARPRPGIARLFAEARRAGLRLAIATTTTPGNVEALLCASFGAASLSWFTIIAAGDCVAAKKPAPDIYHFVLDELRLAAGDCVAFEDSQNGVAAAQAAGIAVVATPSFYSRADDFAEANVVLSDLGEPERPAQHLAGETIAGGLVDVEALRGLVSGPHVSQTAPDQAD